PDSEFEFQRAKAAFTCNSEKKNTYMCCGSIDVKQLGMKEKC
ncbi:hypothetical protein NPIL_282171, partial [Nephila pilipes]